MLRRFGGLPARWRQRTAALARRWRVAAGAILLLAGATALVRIELARRALPQYGGGELYLWFRDAPVMASPPRGRGNEWTFSGPGDWTPKSAQPLRGPFVTTSGERRWFAERRDRETPAYLVEVFPDGSERVIAKYETDAEFGSLSPDGELIAFTLDDPATEAHDAGIIIANADGSEPRRIFQHQGRLRPPQWSSDGGALLTSIFGPPDTVAILRPTGERVASIAAHDVRGIGWCGGTERVVFSARAAEDVAALLHVWTPATGAVERLDWLGAVLSAPECSPDGRAVVYAGVEDGRAVMWLYTFGAAAPTRLPVEAAGLRYVRWANDQPAPVVTTVRIQPPPAQVRTGERVRLRAEVRRSDGTLADDPVTWRSLDSRVAAVLPGGLLIGNHAGTTRIVATAAGWRSDTTTVEVSREAVTEGVLLREAFAELDTARWQIIGEPPALPVVVDGRPALFLAGDGNSTDGLISRDTFALPRGATLEAEFRLPLSRSDGQQFVIGLGTGYLDDRGDPSRSDDWVWTAEAEAGYPLGDLQRADSTSLVLTVDGADAVFSVPPHFTSSEWTHIALQVGPDGDVSLYVNREYVGSGLVRLPMRAGEAWRVILHGASVDTRLLLRNLVLWDGARYGE